MELQTGRNTSRVKKKNLRKKIYLIYHLDEEILGAKLPSNLQVLRLLGHHLRANPMKGFTTKAFSRTAELLMELWAKGRLPTCVKSLAVRKLKALHSEWKSLQKKTAKRRDSTQILRENTFKAIFEDLCDIASVDALQKTNNEEHREFLWLQRQKRRIGSMGAIDVKLWRKEKRTANEQPNTRRGRSDPKRK